MLGVHHKQGEGSSTRLFMGFLKAPVLSMATWMQPDTLSQTVNSGSPQVMALSVAPQKAGEV